MTDGGQKGFAGLESLLSDALPATEATREVPAGVPPAPATRPVAPNESQISSRVPPDAGEFPGLMIFLAAVVLLGILALVLSLGPYRSTDQEASAVPAAPSSRAASSPATNIPVSEILAVASWKANLRAMPQAKAKILSTVDRGTPITVLEDRDGFVKCKTDAGLEGWISRSVLIARVDAVRLAGLSAEEYVKSRNGLQPIDALATYIQKLEPDLLLLRQQVADRSEAASVTVQRIESEFKPADIPADGAASNWYALEARALMDQGDDAGAAKSAQAAVFADPLNADTHTALGYVALKRHDYELVRAVSAVLLALAPSSTNTWVMVGTNAAVADQPMLASAAFARAMDLSKSKGTTVRVLRDLADKSQDVRVASAIAETLAPKASRAEAESSSSSAPIKGR